MLAGRRFEIIAQIDAVHEMFGRLPGGRIEIGQPLHLRRVFGLKFFSVGVLRQETRGRQQDG